MRWEIVSQKAWSVWHIVTNRNNDHVLCGHEKGWGQHQYRNEPVDKVCSICQRRYDGNLRDAARQKADKKRQAAGYTE